MIKGITITLFNKAQTGVDSINNPVYTETAVQVDNVLVSPATTEDVIDSVKLYGKHIVYNLYIPKGDENEWTDRAVEINGVRYRTVGIPKKWIEANVPLLWNKAIGVEYYV